MRTFWDNLSDRWQAALVIVALVLVVVAIIIFLAASLPGPERARAAVEAQGFSDVYVEGFQPALWYCGENDVIRYEIEATNPRGERVSNLYVCAGLLKGLTIRYH